MNKFGNPYILKIEMLIGKLSNMGCCLYTSLGQNLDPPNMHVSVNMISLKPALNNKLVKVKLEKAMHNKTQPKRN